MKTSIKVLIAASSLVSIAGCSNLFNDDGLNEFRKSGQIIDVDYETLDAKIANDESFIFFLKQRGCSSCAKFYPILTEFLTENTDKKMYLLNFNDLEAIEAFTLSSYYLEVLGSDYYEDNEYSTTTLYTPSLCKIVNGEFVDVKIGVAEKSELNYLYQNNYLSMNSYYSYNRKVQKKDTFNLFVSKSKDEEYDGLLRSYFLNNQSIDGYYLDTTEFDDSENSRLLNRVNNYLGEGNAIEALPDYYLLQYEKGALINYVSAKYDVSLLNTLYNLK